MTALAERLLKQADDLDRLFTRVTTMDLASRFGERYAAFQGRIQFSQGSLLAQSLVFNLPQGNDFSAKRLSFVPYIRLISPKPATQGQSERTFRPTTFSFQPASEPFAQAVDFAVELFLGDIALQSAPFCVSQTFSGILPTQSPYGVTSVPFAAFEAASALDFPLDMKAGEVLTARLTPMFTALADVALITDGRIFEFQIVGCLEGAKVLR